MVNRIGVAGKLDLPDSADLEVVVADILKRVREVSNSLQGELRERHRAAAGVAGLDDGATKATVAAEQFDCLLSRAKAVFELDGDQALSTGGPKRAGPA
jgi:hypothetical protein